MRVRYSTFNGSRGLGTLEFAASGMLLLTLIFGGFAAAMLIQSWVQLNYVVDKRLRDSTAQAFVLDSSAVNLRLTVNEQTLEEYIDTLKSSLASDLSATAFASDLGIHGYFVESAYAVLEIDQESGEFKSISKFEASRQGQYRPRDGLLNKTDLRKEFLSSAQLTNGSASKASLYAIPSSRFAAQDGQAHYLPYTVLVGVRAFSSLEGGAAGSLYSALLGEPATYSYKSVMLRGEVG